jgi:ABC-2 type transport system permease protein
MIFTGFDSLSTLKIWESYALTIKQLGLLYHYEALSKGLIDSRDLVYFLSVIVTMLVATKLAIGMQSK